MTTVNSILLFGAKIWGEAMRHEKNRKLLASVQRKDALRIASAYRTVSYAAVQVIVGTIPIDLMVEKRLRIHNRRGDENAKAKERLKTLEKWQKS